MEKQKVYVVKDHYWMDGCGESDYYEESLDSIWRRLEDAKKRIDDLANEYIRRAWYNQECDPEYFTCKEEWAENKLSVKMTVDPYEEQTYWIDVYELDPELPDFEGP